MVQVKDNGAWLYELTCPKVGRFWVYSQGRETKFADEGEEAGGKVGCLFLA